jgi:hypothetical protein
MSEATEKLIELVLNLNAKSGELGEGMCLRMQESAEEIRNESTKD